jgi:hypothetical protein
VISFEQFAQVYARIRESQVEVHQGLAAMFACDLHDILKAADPDYDHHGFWNTLEAARKVEREKWEALLADFRARQAS